MIPINFEQTKFSLRKEVTKKMIADRKNGDSSTGDDRRSPTRGIRFIVTDMDTTDSSDDERDASCSRHIRRHIKEIIIGRENPQSSPKNMESKDLDNTNKRQRRSGKTPKSREGQQRERKKYRGVRDRGGGKWSAEIRDPSGSVRVHLGNFSTAEEAAYMYDRANLHFRGPNAITNFQFVPPTLAAKERQSDYNSGEKNECKIEIGSQNNLSKISSDLGLAEFEVQATHNIETADLWNEEYLALHHAPLEDVGTSYSLEAAPWSTTCYDIQLEEYNMADFWTSEFETFLNGGNEDSTMVKADDIDW